MKVETLQKEIERKIEESSVLFGSPSPFQKATFGALKNGGKRIRPLIVLMVARHLTPTCDGTDAALACECCHTASLIADDLPCMDNEKSRRGGPSLHTLFSEDVALLASYALISLSYHFLERAFTQSDSLSLALQMTSSATGIQGAVGGQYLDLYPSSKKEAALCDMVAKKSGALFELSFVLGWLVGEGDRAKLPLLKEVGRHFGLAFQLADDCADLNADKGKKGSNLFLLLGKKRAQDLLEEEKRVLKTHFSTLRFNSDNFSALLSFLEN